MTFRTLFVGILAAACATFATIGFMMLYLNRPAPDATPKKSIVVARVDLELGQELEENALTLAEWHADTLPDGAYASAEGLVGKYVTIPMIAGEALNQRKIAEEPTNLQAAPGKRVIAIEAKSAAASVGQNLVPGNRVDVLWFSGGKVDKEDDPYTLRLLQNVKVLGVGATKDGAQNRSISLELDPGMDENVLYAQECGTLALALLNPNDTEGVNPVEVNNLKDILEESRESRKALERQAIENPKWVAELTEKNNELKRQVEDLATKTPTREEQLVVDRSGLERLKPGMRGVTIETPTESQGVAGLLEPGDRVDLHFSVKDVFKGKTVLGYDISSDSSGAVCKLMENVEVMAVDTQTEVSEEGMSKKMSNSVTLVVPEEYVSEINLAKQLGELTLVLRGADDMGDGDPKLLSTVQDFVAELAPVVLNAETPAAQTLRVKTFRGTAAGELPLYRLQ